MRRKHYFISLLAGLGIVAAASALWAPKAGRKTRRRLGKLARRAGRTLKQHYEKSRKMRDLKVKAKEKIDGAAEAARKAVGKVVDTSKDVAHSAGKKFEQGGKQLQDA